MGENYTLPKLCRPKNGRWFVYYSIRCKITGHLRRFKRYVPANSNKRAREKEAKDILMETLVALESGWRPDMSIRVQSGTSKMQVTTSGIYLPYCTEKKFRSISKAKDPNHFLFWAEKFVDRAISKGKKSKTIQTYESKLRKFSLWLHYSETSSIVSEIDSHILLEFFNWLVSSEKLANNTILDYKQVLAACFDLVCKEKVIVVNPVRELDDMPIGLEKDCAPRPISNRDVVVFREYIESADPQLWMFIEFMCYCMIRPGNELRLLRVGDVDLYRNLVKIDKDRAKNRKQRHSTLPDHFAKKLRYDYGIEQYNPDWYLFGKGGVPGPIPVGKNNMNNRWVKIREKLNMPPLYKLYSWKHTGNSLALDADVSIYDLRDQNGHSSVAITEIYTRNKLGMTNKAIKEKMPNLDEL